ncbi:hypothetical protein [Paenibacillus sp. sgz500958]|uniref:hypothetical protein n=1 Tax=Paenibacillus sp. sgz500958 TaxID=3242475 RepID=UPI0036D3A206
MSRVGKKLIIFGIWAGVGIWVGMQFGGSGGTTNSPLPGWSVISEAAGNSQNTAGQTTVGQAQGNQYPVSPSQLGNATSGSKTYVYVPVAIDPATGTYKALPTQISGDNSGSGLPQQEVGEYSTLTPGQILVPEEQKPTVDVLADKTAGLLQRASQKGIRWVVSLFASTENGN